jgi:hypothetical protein
MSRFVNKHVDGNDKCMAPRGELRTHTFTVICKTEQRHSEHVSIVVALYIHKNGVDELLVASVEVLLNF